MDTEISPEFFYLVAALKLFLRFSFELGAEECPHVHIERSKSVKSESPVLLDVAAISASL